MRSPELLIAFDGALAALAIVMGYQGRTVPAVSMLAVLVLLGVWQLVLFTTTRNATATFQVEPFFRKTHYIQAVLHATIYCYLGLYWPRIAHYAPLLLGQILVGYLCDMLLAWTRGRPWRMGLGTLPIIFSTNLFLWFHEEYFYYQLAMIVLAFFSKEFITWEYDGRRRHIFNPSAFPLSVVSLILLLTDSVGLTYGVDLVGAFELGPNFYEVIFLLGLVTQALFLTTPVSVGACVALFGYFLITKPLLGEHLTSTPIQIQVFLGLTFLVTDPATSPRSAFGRFLFGLAYGTGVFVTFILLRYIHQPAFFDKLLVVPVVNLMVPFFDRLSSPVDAAATRWLGARTNAAARYGWLAAYVALFAFMLPYLKIGKTRPSTILPPPAMKVSDEMRRLTFNHVYCRTVHPQAYKPFGLYYELTHLAEIRQIYHRGPAGTVVRP